MYHFFLSRTFSFFFKIIIFYTKINHHHTKFDIFDSVFAGFFLLVLLKFNHIFCHFPVTGTTTVKIYLDDVNDNGPYFRPTVPVGNITENQAPRTEVAIDLKDYTFDLDTNQNQIYYYFLLDHNDKFEVGTQTNGLVRAKVTLDREQIAQYSLKLRVVDSGVPAMTSTLSLKIRVVDVNDNPSTSRQANINVYTYTGQLADGPIADVRPSDPDVVGDYRCTLNTAAPFRIMSACNLYADSNVNMAQTYTLDFTGQDGIHPAVSYRTPVTFKQFDQGMVENSIVLKLASLSASQFLIKYDQFVTELNNAVQGQGSAEIYSMLETGSTLTLFIAMKEPSGTVVSRISLAQMVETKKGQIESNTQFVIEYVNYNPCSQVPCKNSGECSSKIETIDQFRHYSIDSFIFTSPSVRQVFKCTCTGDYTGETCEEPLNKCQNNPCKNQGVCSIRGSDGSFVCQCTAGWKGATCEEDVNECVEVKPCRNLGTCQNLAGSYQCVCPQSYTGKNCTDKVPPCLSKPCQNGGTCTESNGAFKCTCQYGYRGNLCEIESKGFTPLSYMQFTSKLDSTSNVINIELATRQQNALLLLYKSQSTYEFLALEIIQGSVRLSYSLGNTETAPANEIVRMTAPVTVSNGQWYSIIATRVNKVSLMVMYVL